VTKRLHAYKHATIHEIDIKKVVDYPKAHFVMNSNALSPWEYSHIMCTLITQINLLTRLAFCH